MCKDPLQKLSKKDSHVYIVKVYGKYLHLLYKDNSIEIKKRNLFVYNLNRENLHMNNRELIGFSILDFNATVIIYNNARYNIKLTYNLGVISSIRKKLLG